MNQAVMLINCYLYGATAVMLLVLVLIVYLRGQMNHFPNPFAKKNLVYRHPAQANSKKRVTYTRFFVIINKNMYLLLQVQIMGQSICYNIHTIKKCT